MRDEFPFRIMDTVEYEFDVKIEESEQEKWESILSDIESNYDIKFERNRQKEESVEPTTIIAIYSAAIGTAGLLLKINDRLIQEDGDVPIEVNHYGEGDVYVIDADEATSLGSAPIEVQNEKALVELSVEETMELKQLRQEKESDSE